MENKSNYNPWLTMPKHIKNILNNPIASVVANNWENAWNWNPSPANITSAPCANILEFKNYFTVSLDVPGTNREDINISIENNILIVSGNRKSCAEIFSTESQSHDQIIGQEQFEGSFFRRFALPAPIAQNKITAKLENGVLFIKLPKVNNSSSCNVVIG